MLIYGRLYVCLARLVPNGAGLQGKVGDVCAV